MEVTTRRYKHCDVVSATGRVDAYTAPQLAEAFAAITGADRYRIVFDMSGVDYISSAGLRVLVDAQRICKRFNRGRVVIASVASQVQRALELAGFYTVFRVYDTTLDALGDM
jgi:anti-sigma B factor antagonist